MTSARGVDALMMRAHRIAGVMRYAALQFVVLTAIAMVTYAGGAAYVPSAARYQFTGNFLSDLGATTTWWGRPNHVSAALFFVALVSVGVALVAFAWTWRTHAFGQQRARTAGHISAIAGTLSGISFVGVAVTPENLALTQHNQFVLAAFGMLLVYVAAVTWLMAANGTRGMRLAINLSYLAIVVAYVVVIVVGPTQMTAWGFMVQVIAQKIVVYVSMAHIVYLTTTARLSQHATRGRVST